MRALRRLLSYMGSYKTQLLLGIGCVLVTTSIGLLFPIMIQNLIDNILVNGNPSGAIGRLNRLAAIFVTLYGARWVFQYFNTYFISLAGYGTVRNIRDKSYEHLMRLSLEYYETRTTGDAISRVTNDVAMVQNGISQALSDFVYSVFSLIGVVAAIFVSEWRLALLTVFIIPALGFVVSRFGDKIRQIGHEVQAKLADITTILHETLSGISVVKAHTAESREISRFRDKNEENFVANMRGVRLLAILFPAVEVILAVGVLMVIFVGGRLVINGNMTPGELMAFITYLALASTPAGSISRTYSGIQASLAAADRIFDLLDSKITVDDDKNAKVLKAVEGYVSFNDVYFEYRVGQPVLSGVSLDVKPGEVIAIVGPSGAGKTSMVNLIARFYDVTSGTLMIDGLDVRSVTTQSLREHIGMVLQDSLLFTTSLRENIAYGKPNASKEEIEAAARAANAHGFISELPQGYETLVGERGATLSGGQRQRVAIARALLRDPRILILDEATSALDSESELLVKDALECLMKGRTTFIIAHRLSTIRNATRIAVLEGGRISEVGNHDDLIARNGTYAKLYKVQFEANQI